MFETNTKRGFMAIVTVLIVGLVFLFAVISLGRLSIAGRFLLLTVEDKVQSEESAEACVQIARIYITNDPSYAGASVPVSFKKVSCTIVSVVPNTPSAGQSRIRTKAVVNGSTTNFNVVVNMTTGAIVSWTELMTL